jgi:hypothetical protein
MQLLDAGVDTAVIALWLGHESIRTTDIYQHADPGMKERALARLTPRRSPAGRYRPPDALLAFLEAPVIMRTRSARPATGDQHNGHRPRSVPHNRGVHIKAEARLRISFARRSSLFSRSRSRIRARSSVVSPGRRPSSISARRTHTRSVSRCTSSFSAIDTIALHCDGYSPWCSNTIRTARSRSSSGYLPPFPTPDIAPSSQGLEPPRIPGRFMVTFVAFVVNFARLLADVIRFVF